MRDLGSITRRLGMFGVLLAAASVAGCAGAAPQPPAAGGDAMSQTTTKAPPVNRVVLITEAPQRSSVEMRIIAEPNMWMLRPMYDDLILIDPKSGKFAPGMATAWAIEPDGRSYRLKLRSGVKFHGDWGEVQAQDIAFAWQRLVLPDSPHGQSNYFRTLVKDVQIVNDHEVVFQLNRADGQFTAALSEQQAGLEAQSRANFEKAGPATWQTGPLAGSGPYQWLTGEDGVFLRFARAPGVHPFRTTPAFPELEGVASVRDIAPLLRG